MQLPPRLRPRKTPEQERSRALVSAVLEAGSRILVQCGYEGLTMSAVSRRAGVSVGSLYQYFSSKESLVAALIEQRSEAEVTFVGQRLEQLAPDAGLEQILLHAVQSALAFRAAAPELHLALLDSIAFLGRHPLLVARGERVVRQLQALIAPRYALMAEGRAEALPPLPHVLYVLANAIHSVTHEGLLRRPTDLDDAALARHVTSLTLGYLRSL